MANNRRKSINQPLRRGPHPDTLKIEGDWKDAMKKALQKKRPAEGWPRPERPDKKDKK